MFLHVVHVMVFHVRHVMFGCHVVGHLSPATLMFCGRILGIALRRRLVGISAAATLRARMIGVVLLFHVARIATTAPACGIGFLTCLHRTRITVATARVHCTATLSLFLLITLLAGRLRKTDCECNQDHSD